MRRIQVLGLVASVATLLCGGGNALGQQVVGGMGEPVHMGAFGAHADSLPAKRNPAAMPSARTRRKPNPEMPGAQSRQVTPTLPGRHLR
ncbi:hypothetical protein CupriaWKF_28985 [Cupriavidus sp. WKF15]|uniref:hypothetical protein n=1 Tax=Cupriavidus sp. WKF15 TaxID=3032282 RepID=UPI0023E10B07|nr:hypothetical protein [Cupriavidus sp. WKF15]WER48796.1 hypothetical protein CupriaWKF_28985 [Cupriavidus sp. WKF15]